jgi:hypothetical protein
MGQGVYYISFYDLDVLAELTLLKLKSIKVFSIIPIAGTNNKKYEK